MEAEAIITHVVCDDILKNLKIKEDIQSKVTNAEVMTTAIATVLLFSYRTMHCFLPLPALEKAFTFAIFLPVPC